MPRVCLLSLLIVAGCVRNGTVAVLGAETETSAGTLGDGDDSDDGGSDGLRLDLPDNGVDACVAMSDGTMGVGKCTQAAPPDAFEPSIQWSWIGPNGDTDTRVIPLVINLTDDNADGAVDLCDTPDIIVTAGPPPGGNLMTMTPPDAHLYALDGALGTEHWRSSDPVRAAITPAVADLEGDGLAEIVTLETVGDLAAPLQPSRLVIFGADGTLRLRSADVFDAPASGAVALADLDADGDAEIMVGNRVFDHEGNALFEAPDVGETTGLALMPVAADLDGDGDLEVVWSRAAYHHTGEAVWTDAPTRAGFVHIANLDADPNPEIIITTDEGLVLLDNRGQSAGPAVKPLEIPDSIDTWRRPAAIHDIDADRRPELLLSIGEAFVALGLNEATGQLTIEFDHLVNDKSGNAAGTAFDFLGDGSAEAMYADENQMFAFDTARGGPAFTAARSSVTVEEYPVVADVDSDGSAEIVVGSNATRDTADPTIRVIGDAGNRWVQARRVWNQHTYHVTNVDEAGRLPAPEPRHWLRTNTFRTNAQIEAGVICLPEP